MMPTEYPNDITARDRSVYTVRFETVCGRKEEHVFRNLMIPALAINSRPLSAHGVNYIGDDGFYYCIPWHQIKWATYKEEPMARV